MEITGVTYSTADYEHYNQTGDKNYFEEIIDAMILDGIAGMNDSFKNAIKGLSRDKKRMTILSLLDKDLNLFKRIKALTDKNINKMDHIKDIILMLREYVKVGEVEKKKFGEVMTPLELVKEMLATLPKEVWSNPNLKWLDPANGTGPYPIMVIYKLMKGLETWEPDVEKRYKHIVENMIYVCELQPKNMFLYMCAVDPFDTYKLNIYTGSFLDEGFDKHMKDVWCVDKFDVVIGNPPYQTSNATGDNKLYLDFSKKSISILLESGILLFVTPKNITDYILLCDKNRRYFDDFYQIENLVIDTPAKYFPGVGSTFLYFNIKKEKYKNPTKVICYNTNMEVVMCNILLERGQSIPNTISDIDLSLISKIRKVKYMFDFKKMKVNDREFRIRKKQFDIGKVSKNKNDEYIYPVIDGINKNNPFPGKVFYMKDDFSDKKPKLIINGSGYLCPSFDESGKYFLSDNMIYIHVKDEKEFKNLKYIIESKIAKYWLNQFRLNGFSDSKNIQIFPYIPFDREWTDEQLFDYFGLTEEERNIVLDYDKNKKYYNGFKR